MSNTSSVNIQVDSNIKYENHDEEQMHLQYKGVLYLKNGVYYLRYKEDDALQIGNTSTTVKWKKGNTLEVIMIRQGDVKSNQVFMQGITSVSPYQTDFGTMEMKITTDSIEIQEESLFNGNIHIRYRLELQQQVIGSIQLNIHYEETEGDTYD